MKQSPVKAINSAGIHWPFWKPLLFILVVIVGLFYVKWQPYWFKAFTAADTQSIGSSILAAEYSSPLQAAWQYTVIYFLAVWKAAVLGIVLGSLIQVLIPRDWLIRVLGQGRFSTTLLGSALSLPGMMCTCCAAPVAAGMRKQSVSAGATIAFWLGNPVLNPATLVFMGFVLGWQFSALRLIAGLVMVLGIATIVQRLTPELTDDQNDRLSELRAQHQPNLNQDGFISRWGKALWSLFWSTIPFYILAVMILGAARVWLFPHVDDVIGNSLFWLVALAIAGSLFVIPTAAEIPIVQAMMQVGMGIGSAFALLMTLPAISLPSLLMMRTVFPVRILALVAVLVMLVGIVTGLIALALLA